MEKDANSVTRRSKNEVNTVEMGESVNMGSSIIDGPNNQSDMSSLVDAVTLQKGK